MRTNDIFYFMIFRGECHGKFKFTVHFFLFPFFSLFILISLYFIVILFISFYFLLFLIILFFASSRHFLGWLWLTRSISETDFRIQLSFTQNGVTKLHNIFSETVWKPHPSWIIKSPVIFLYYILCVGFVVILPFQNLL